MWRPPQMNPYAQGMPDELVDGSGTGSGRTTEEHATKKPPGLTDGYNNYKLIIIIIIIIIPGQCLRCCHHDSESLREFTRFTH